MNFILTQALPTGAVATLDWVIMGEGLAFSVIIGLVAGVYPALRAAKLDPIEALRHE
jgi:putative ABC transport system permease protein